MTLPMLAFFFMPQGSGMATPVPAQTQTTVQLPAAQASFVVPDGFELTERSKLDGFVESMRSTTTPDNKVVLDCLTVPMRGVERRADDIASITVLSLDAPCAKMHKDGGALTEFALGMVNGIGKGKRSGFAPPLRYEIAGHDAVLLRGAIYSGTGRATQMFEACLWSEAAITCWQASSSLPEHLAQLAATRIHFTHGEIVPLVPEADFQRATAAAQRRTGP